MPDRSPDGTRKSRMPGKHGIQPLRFEHPERLIEPVEQMHRRGARETLRLDRHHLLPVDEAARDLGVSEAAIARSLMPMNERPVIIIRPF